MIKKSIPGRLGTKSLHKKINQYSVFRSQEFVRRIDSVDIECSRWIVPKDNLKTTLSDIVSDQKGRKLCYAMSGECRISQDVTIVRAQS